MNLTEGMEALKIIRVETPEGLLDFHERVSYVSRELMGNKNHDYTGGDPDPFQNFREDGELGIAIRLGDKIRRLKHFFRTGKLRVKEEQVFDTGLDIITYTILLLGLYTNRGSVKKEVSEENTVWVVHDTFSSGYLPLNEDGFLPVQGEPATWPWVRDQHKMLISHPKQLGSFHRVIAEMPVSNSMACIQFSRGNSHA